MGTLFRFAVLIGCATLAGCMTAYYGDSRASNPKECKGPNTCEVQVGISCDRLRCKFELPDPIDVYLDTYPDRKALISWRLQPPPGIDISFPDTDGIKFEDPNFKCRPELHSRRAGGSARAQYLAFWCEDSADPGKYRYGAKVLIDGILKSIDPFAVNH